MKRILLGISILLGTTLSAQYNVDFEDGSKTGYAQGTVSLNGIDWDMTEALIGTSASDYHVGAKSARLRGYETSSISMIADKANGIGDISFNYRQYGSDTQVDWQVEYSTDGGTNWTVVGSPFTAPSTGDTITFNQTVNVTGNARVRFVRATMDGNTSNRRLNVDDLIITDYTGGAVVDTITSISTADMTVLENIGSVNVTVNLNQSAALDKTVDLILASGNAAVLNNYTTQTVTFTGGSTSETVTINVTQGQLASSSETFSFALSNPSSDLVLGTDVDFLLTVNQLPSNPSSCSEIFFSEYIESTGDKALEIYNPTTSIVDLSDYQVRRYSNGASTPTSTLSLSGNLIPGDVFVICNSTADSIILSEADIISGITGYNGDDAIELYNTASGNSVDILGEIGIDPGTSWTVGSGATEDVTLVRMASVDAGNLTWMGGSDQEWDVYGLAEFSYIGSHSNTGCPAPANPVAYPIGQNSYCVGDSIVFTHNSFGGTEPYTVQWSIGGIPVSTNDTVSYVATAATSLTVVLQVTDNNSAVDDSTFTITINNIPSAGFTLSSSSICAEDTTFITSTGSGTGLLSYSYSATPSGGTLSTGGASGSGYFTSATDGSYLITQMLTDFNGCMDTASHTVIVNPLDDATFSALTDLCDDESLSLVHSDNSGIWSGTGVTDGGNGTGTFASSTGGDHYITYTTGGTCPDAYTDTVAVLASPTANFTYTGSITVDFTDASTGSPATYDWDFGDGGTETTANPSHTYAADGSYTVCLVVTNASGCDDTLCQSVTIAGVGVSELNNINVSFYPNPTNDELNVQTSNPVNVTIYNVIGKQVLRTRINANKVMSVSHLESGSYFIQFENNGQRFTEKLIIE